MSEYVLDYHQEAGRERLAVMFQLLDPCGAATSIAWARTLLRPMSPAAEGD